MSRLAPCVTLLVDSRWIFFIFSMSRLDPVRTGHLLLLLLSPPPLPRITAPALLPQDMFPPFADMITDEGYERLVLQDVSRLPAFSYTGPVLHLGQSAVLMGEFWGTNIYI